MISLALCSLQINLIPRGLPTLTVTRPPQWNSSLVVRRDARDARTNNRKCDWSTHRSTLLSHMSALYTVLSLVPLALSRPASVVVREQLASWRTSRGTSSRRNRCGTLRISAHPTIYRYVLSLSSAANTTGVLCVHMYIYVRIVTGHSRPSLPSSRPSASDTRPPAARRRI
jgi:hypothetical protein